MKKKIWLLCLCIIALCISFPHALNVIEIDASKDYSNGIQYVPIRDDVRFILSPNESILLSHIELPELNTGLYYCYYGVGYGIADTSVLISYKYENWYNLYRQYDRANGDSATFAKKILTGWCITLGSPDTIWSNSLQYPDSVIGCDTFQFGTQGEKEMTYFRARPIIEYYEYHPPPPDPSVYRDTVYPEYSIIQYIATKCLDFTRHMKIQVAYINHSTHPHTLWLYWAADSMGNGIFINDTSNINNPYFEQNYNDAFPKFSKMKNHLYFHDIRPNTNVYIYNLQGVLMKSKRLSYKEKEVKLNFPKGMYILSVVKNKKRYSTKILIK